MSYWSDREDEANVFCAEAFGQDPVRYTDLAGHTYDVVFVAGNPPHADGGKVAFCHLWARSAVFQQPPAAGDIIETPAGKRLTVFSVHAEAVDGQLEPSAYWLSLNETS